MMFDLGCHLIDALVGLLGRPRAITPFIRHDSSFEDTLADNTAAVFEFERAIAVLESSAMEVGASQRRQFVVCGTRGTAIVQPIELPRCDSACCSPSPATARMAVRPGRERPPLRP